ncbi:hypothetical protein An16g05800 [Aspergillus niger]|uniref:Uncharacterized protein n=2 Tax=Aspergillus niger TaxID=5061 RepID=A2R846_ASPNC|nr:hypothetical protein An16g05800 [Aspergillus niger]CAK46920.1 hypothetical protein An16g05800 [Aspergillus niger]
MIQRDQEGRRSSSSGSPTSNAAWNPSPSQSSTTGLGATQSLLNVPPVHCFLMEYTLDTHHGAQSTLFAGSQRPAPVSALYSHEKNLRVCPHAPTTATEEDWLTSGPVGKGRARLALAVT